MNRVVQSACALVVASSLIGGCGDSEESNPLARSCEPVGSDTALGGREQAPDAKDSQQPDTEDHSPADWSATFEVGGVFDVYGEGISEGRGAEAVITTTADPSGGGSVAMMRMPRSIGVEADRVNRRLLDAGGEITWRSGDEYWYGLRLRLGNDWQLEDIRDDREQFTSLVSFRYVDSASRNGTGSIKIVPGVGTPCLMHTRAALSADEYSDGAGEDPLNLGPVDKGKWIDLICHFKWSHRSRGGLKECWRDGQYMGRSTRRNMTVDLPVRHRIGIYQGTGVDHQRTLFWDDHRIGRQYGAVDPASVGP